MRRSSVGKALGPLAGAGWLFLAAWFPGAGASEPPRPTPDLPRLTCRNPALDQVLEEMARREGVSLERFRVDPAGMALEQTLTGQFRLTAYLMEEPLRAPATVEAFGRHLAATTSTVERFRFLANLAWPSGTLVSGRTAPPSEVSAGSLEKAVEDLYRKTGKRFQGPDREDVMRESHTLPEPLQHAIADILAHVYAAHLVREQVVKDSEFKLGGAFGARTKRTSDNLRAFLGTWWGADSLSNKEYERVVAGLQTVDLSALYIAGRELAGALERSAERLSTPPETPRPDFHYSWYTPRGRIGVGGTGPDTWEGTYVLVIDLGGDDVYVGPGAVSGWEPASLVLDLGGNDRYEGSATNRAGPGGAILGYAAVVDRGRGRDTYACNSWGGGFGFLGMGWIADDGGDDTYRMSWMSQGAGMFGIGMLSDAAGNDTYIIPANGDTLPWGRAQGFAGPAGMGLLLDQGGDDRYAVEDAEDSQEPPVFVQGTCSGVEPYHAGGLGLLVDAAGDDRYRGRGRAQGVGSHGGLGILVDLGGNDDYESAGAAQGVGLERGVGVLLDLAGNDTYVVSTSQPNNGLGLGARFGLGCFVDGGGDDSYRAGLSGGVSLALGGGMFLDLAGRDRYELAPRSGAAVQGALDSEALWQVEIPAFALFVDLAGQPRGEWPFPEPAGTSGYWAPRPVAGQPWRGVGGGYCAVPDSMSSGAMEDSR